MGDEVKKFILLGLRSLLLPNRQFLLVLLSQRKVLPPNLSAKVASSLCPSFLFLHWAPVWPHAPCDQQYLSVLLRTKVRLGGFVGAAGGCFEVRS